MKGITTMHIDWQWRRWPWRRLLLALVAVFSVTALLVLLYPPTRTAAAQVIAPVTGGETPTLSATDAAELSRRMMLLENLSLKVQLFQTQAQQAQTELQAFVKTLERPGYALQQMPDGKFAYVPAGAAK
jgi:hypothetical protein